VEKLEKILRFIIKEQALSRIDLDKIWNSSCGKHEAIEKNVHDLLAKLAWDFSPEQLEHLFDCFRVWDRSTASIRTAACLSFTLGKLDESQQKATREVTRTDSSIG
jgi:hypothetical protein